MTIDQMLAILQKKKATMGGDALVLALWDGAPTDIRGYGVQNNALIFDVDLWGDVEAWENLSDFNYSEFECTND